MCCDRDEVFLVKVQVMEDCRACKAALAACICHGRKLYRLRLLAEIQVLCNHLDVQYRHNVK